MTRLLIPALLALVSAFAQVPAAPAEFEVASVKRNVSDVRPWLVPPAGGRFTATNVSLKLLLGVAWPEKVTGGPSWVATDGYDVSAKEPDRTVTRDEFSLMMRNLLKERFRLIVHKETRETQVYVLLAVKGGLKLAESNPEPCLTGVDPADQQSQALCGTMNVTPELIANEKISMQWFTEVLAGVLGRPVVNNTGFTGSFKVRLEFAPVSPGNDANIGRPSVFSALEQQLGLKVESRRGSEEVLVIDHVERPSAN